MIAARLVPICVLALFALGLLSARTMTAQAPAFQPDLLVESVTGETRIPRLLAMYDHGSYLFQIGYGYLKAEVVPLPGLEGPGQVTPLAVAAERLERARSVLEQSLRLDPSNAYAWQSYAQTLIGVPGGLEASQQAMEMAWQLAPHTHQLALGRIYLIDQYRTLSGDPALFEEIRASDLAVLERHRPEMAATLAGS